MDIFDTLVTCGISLGLGLLVGLQRERKGDELAGIRTFALLTVLGTVAGLVGRQMGTWMVPAGAVALGGLMAVGAYLKARVKEAEIGLTTEIAALLMYVLGAYLATGLKEVAIVLGATVALLLYWKAPLHGFVQRMGDKDVAAIMQFALIALVILPVLPKERYGPEPYNVFNPFETWLVVVLVVGISLVGYVLHKLVPVSASAVLGGAIGGLVSSTATTVSYARRSRGNPAFAPLAAQAIMMANAVSVLRVLILLAIFAQPILPAMAAPLATLAAVMAALGGAAYWAGRRASAELPEHGNPAELKAALLFGGIYALVKLATAYGKAHFGASGLYLVGGISGLTDVDAITLVTVDMTKPADTGIAVAVAWRVIAVAILSNLVFKAGCVLVLGSARLKAWVGMLFGASLLGGALIVWLWPG